jgi:hypothetical protein
LNAVGRVAAAFGVAKERLVAGGGVRAALCIAKKGGHSIGRVLEAGGVV